MRWVVGSVNLIVPLAMLGLALSLIITNPAGLVTDLRYAVFDSYQRYAPRAYETTPVRYVDIDDESLTKIGQWPWPRTEVATLVDRLAELGAAVIVFDMVFAEDDRLSPSHMANLLADSAIDPSLKSELLKLPSNDSLLADTLARRGNVVGGFALIGRDVGAAPKQIFGLVHQGDEPLQFLPRFPGVVKNLDVLEASVAGNGSFNFLPERDNVVRRVPLMLRLRESIYPALSIEALRVGLGASTFQIKSSGANQETALGAASGLNNIKVGPVIIPTTADGQMWIHYSEDVPERRVAAWEVMQGTLAPERINGTIVFIGTSAAGLLDLRATPLAVAVPGVEIHVQALEQMLLGHFLTRPDWAEGAELLFILFLGGGLIWLLRRLGALPCALIGAGGIALALGGSALAFTEEKLLLDPVGPSIAVFLIYLSASLLNFLRTEAEKRQVRSAFGQYLSPALVEQLAEDPELLKLGGETKDMTFLFCDIRGFTAISEQFKSNPQGLTQLINRFLTPMTDAILQKGGTIDKYMGDCIMAFWNAPLNDEDHVRHAQEAALEMLERLEQVNAQRKQEDAEEGREHIPIRIGIGINSGSCVVGNMGSDQRFDYSVLGDAVNLASRLEGQSKNYGVTSVVGEDSRARYNKMALLELDLIAVKGREEPVHIFALMGDTHMATEPDFLELNQCADDFYSAWRAGHFDEAELKLKTLGERGGEKLSVLCALYEERLAAVQADPPTGSWDGIYRADTK